MSNDFINKVTLDCLVSPSIKHKINYKPVNIKADVKFYKNRILTLTRDQVMRKEAPCLDVKIAFEKYAIACIDYFKSLDNNDSIQDTYKDLDLLDENLVDSSSCEQMTLEDANSLMMRKIPLTMDAFVTKTTTKKPIFLPQQHDTNYYDPSLKMKGVKDNKPTFVLSNVK
jgi:hypothetical protein